MKFKLIAIITAYLVFIGVNIRAEEEAPIPEEPAIETQEEKPAEPEREKAELTCTKELLIQALNTSIRQLRTDQNTRSIVINQTTVQTDTLWRLLETARAREKLLGRLDWLSAKCEEEAQ